MTLAAGIGGVSNSGSAGRATMRNRGKLRLTTEQTAFTVWLCRQLNRQGIPVEYGALRIAIANWWLGNAGQSIPEDNERLAACLSQAITAWTRKARPIDDLSGFVVFQMKLFAARQPLTSPLRQDGSETSLAETVRMWQRTDKPGGHAVPCRGRNHKDVVHKEGQTC